MPLKAKKVSWRKGNGTLIFGTGIMLICLAITLMIIQTFVIRQNARDTQLAADSIADGTAVYMANEGGDYEDALGVAQEIQRLINENTNSHIGNSVQIDQELLEEENKVEATVTSHHSLLDSMASLSSHWDPSSYNITRSATTEFTGMGSNVDYVNWIIMIANDDSHGYSLSRRFLNPDVDCASFVYYALLNNGYGTDQLGTYPFTTFVMPDILTSIGFREIPYSRSVLQPGDILWTISHTEVYIGDNQRVGAHSDYDRVPGDSSGEEVDISPMHDNWTRIYRPG